MLLGRALPKQEFKTGAQNCSLADVRSQTGIQNVMSSISNIMLGIYRSIGHQSNCFFLSLGLKYDSDKCDAIEDCWYTPKYTIYSSVRVRFTNEFFKMGSVNIGWLVRWSIMISKEGRKFHFHAPIRALVQNLN